MNPKAIQMLAALATCLVIATGASRLMRPAAPPPEGPQKKSVVSNTGKKQGEQPCTIKRAAFGGTQTSLLKATKGKVVHYIVLDRPQGNPLIPFYQQDWLEANYGPAKPAVVGEFASVEAAVMKAGSLCRRN
jgi:hypothetical protein